MLLKLGTRTRATRACARLTTTRPSLKLPGAVGAGPGAPARAQPLFPGLVGRVCPRSPLPLVARGSRRARPVVQSCVLCPLSCTPSSFFSSVQLLASGHLSFVARICWARASAPRSRSASLLLLHAHAKRVGPVAHSRLRLHVPTGARVVVVRVLRLGLRHPRQACVLAGLRKGLLLVSFLFHLFDFFEHLGCRPAD